MNDELNNDPVVLDDLEETVAPMVDEENSPLILTKILIFVV